MTDNNIPEITNDMTAGEMLRTARTTGRRKREIATIAKQLCIREEFLQALEDGKYYEIPETVYILGFARNYAMELGLNPDDVVNKLKREMGLVSDCADTATECELVPEKKKFSFVALWAFVRNYAKKLWAYVRKHWKWAVGGLVGVIIILFAIILLLPSGNIDVSANENAASNTVAANVAVPEPKYTVAVRERFGTENREKANIILQATQESWVKIEDSRGKTEFSRVLVAGDVYYMPQGNGYRATFGNAGGVDIWVDGKLAPAAGADHTRVTGIAMQPDKLMKVSE